MNNVGQFRAVRDISLYPLDLSNQAELDDNDDSTNSQRGSLERQVSLESPGKKRRPVPRNVSIALQEVYIWQELELSMCDCHC